MFVPFSISIENITFHISSYSILLSSSFQAVRLSGYYKCLCAVAKFKSSGIYMVTHCNLARLHYLDGSVGGLCRNHRHVARFVCVGTTIVWDFGGETKVKKRHGGFRSTAPHQRCFNILFSLVQYIFSVFLHVT